MRTLSILIPFGCPLITQSINGITLLTAAHNGARRLARFRSSSPMAPNLDPGWLDPYIPVPAKSRRRCACPRPLFPTVAIGIGGARPGKSAIPTPGAFGSNPRRGSTQASGLYLAESAALSWCRSGEFRKWVQGVRDEDVVFLCCIDVFFYHTCVS